MNLISESKIVKSSLFAWIARKCKFATRLLVEMVFPIKIFGGIYEGTTENLEKSHGTSRFVILGANLILIQGICK